MEKKKKSETENIASKNNFSCTQCNFSTDKKSKLKSHIEFTHGKNKLFQCEECNYSSNRDFNLRQHMQSKHSKKRHFKCDRCDYSAKLRSSLTKHIKTMHDDVWVFKCDRCNNFSTKSRIKLSKHLCTCHPKIKEYRKIACRSDGTKNDPINTELSTGAIVIPVQDPLLAIPVPSILDAPNVDPTATINIDFSQIQSSNSTFGTLTKPSLEHYIEPPSNLTLANVPRFRGYKCIHCPYSTVTNSDMQRHVRSVHDNIRDFHCQYCDYSATMKKVLLKHIQRNHETSIDFICGVCKYSSKSAEILRAHVRKVHGVKKKAKKVAGNSIKVETDIHVGTFGQDNAGNEVKDVNIVKVEPDIDYKDEPIMESSIVIDEIKVETVIKEEPREGYSCQLCITGDSFDKEGMESHLLEQHSMSLETYLEANYVFVA